MLARLEQVRSNLKESQEAARNALQLAEEHPLSTNRFIQVNSDLARLWLAQGNLEKVSHLIQKAGLAVNDDIPYQREPEYVILLRLLIAQRNIEAALALSERLLQTAQAAGRMGLVTEVLILQALAFQEKKDTESALEALERAFSLAQPEGLVRLFLDEGEPMTRLLCQSQSRQVGVTYATELMSTIGQTSSMTQPSMQLLIEPLTTRELEVLKFIETGDTNQEIAEKLVISTATVKRHITNIYGKLGVKNRTQSIAIGKELKLFD